MPDLRLLCLIFALFVLAFCVGALAQEPARMPGTAANPIVVGTAINKPPLPDIPELMRSVVKNQKELEAIQQNSGFAKS